MSGPDDSAERGGELPELLAARRRKLEALREAGLDPFPHAFADVTPIGDIRAEFDALEPGAETDRRARVAGRLAASRPAGKMAFLDLIDRSGRLQLQARVDDLGEEDYGRLVSLDLGDLIGADGTIFATKRGELTLRVERFQLLAKSLRPPPEKYHGLRDVETRYRQRELDLMANDETRALFLIRAKATPAIL